MFEVTEIKYKDNYIKVNFNTGESMNLAFDIFDLYSLSKGKLVDQIEYKQLKKESDRYNCLHKALGYLSIRARSSLEIQKYLFKKDFSKDIVTETIAKLKESGYIDDFSFAINYIKSTKRKKAVGKNLLKNELYKKGVAKEIIKKAINETRSQDNDFDSLYQLALKKLKQLENKNNKMSKLVFFLKQRGFEDNDIRSVIGLLKDNEYDL